MTFVITVRGKVQGVFFRASTRDKARELNLTGFVRNQSDGSVYLEASGNEDQLNKLVAWCKVGPKSARVDQVEVTQLDSAISFDSFEIRR